MNEIQVVDEFIHPNDHEELQRMVQAKEFPWTVAVIACMSKTNHTVTASVRLQGAAPESIAHFSCKAK